MPSTYYHFPLRLGRSVTTPGEPRVILHLPLHRTPSMAAPLGLMSVLLLKLSGLGAVRCSFPVEEGAVWARRKGPDKITLRALLSRYENAAKLHG